MGDWESTIHIIISMPIQELSQKFRSDRPRSLAGSHISHFLYIESGDHTVPDRLVVKSCFPAACHILYDSAGLTQKQIYCLFVCS
jgi:hypothetical protein